MLLNEQKSYNDLLHSCVASTQSRSELLRFVVAAVYPVTKDLAVRVWSHNRVFKAPRVQGLNFGETSVAKVQHWLIIAECVSPLTLHIQSVATEYLTFSDLFHFI